MPACPASSFFFSNSISISECQHVFFFFLFLRLWGGIYRNGKRQKHTKIGKENRLLIMMSVCTSLGTSAAYGIKY